MFFPLLVSCLFEAIYVGLVDSFTTKMANPTGRPERYSCHVALKIQQVSAKKTAIRE